jgi:hypothetical protein
MAGMDNEYLENFDAALAKWTDSRMVSAEDIKTMAMFLMYLVNLAEDDGWTYRGHSWKESEYLGCLVVKAVVDGVPSVVFTNAKTTIAGMRIFLRKMEGDFLEWVPDKYA